MNLGFSGSFGGWPRKPNSPPPASGQTPKVLESKASVEPAPKPPSHLGKILDAPQASKKHTHTPALGKFVDAPRPVSPTPKSSALGTFTSAPLSVRPRSSAPKVAEHPGVTPIVFGKGQLLSPTGTMPSLYGSPASLSPEWDFRARGSAHFRAEFESAPARARGMKIALISSRSSRCGIATYTSYLESALAAWGAVVRHWASRERGVFDDIRSWGADVLHVQYEQAIMPDDATLAAGVQKVRNGGAVCLATLHSETAKSAMTAMRSGFERVLLHRPPRIAGRACVLTMPCPVYGAVDRAALRRQYGFETGAFVISTVGFLLPWKMTAEIAGELLPFLRNMPRATLQIIASHHFNPEARSYAENCSNELRRLSESVGGRIAHVAGYPSDAEVLDRLALSDLGYTYCPFDTQSSSAAASLFISARCPLIASDSTHYEHLPPSVERVPKGSAPVFASGVTRAAQDPGRLVEMRKALDQEYSEVNYLEFARIHLGIYLRLKGTRR